MHVLSLPPAFVLSQDQTLKLKEFDLDFHSTQIDRVLPGFAFPQTRWYSPKHRLGRYRLGPLSRATPQGHRRPRFSLSYSLVKEQHRQMRSDLLQRPFAPDRVLIRPGRCKAPKSSAPSVLAAPSMDVGLQQTLSGVNTGSNVFSIEPSSFRQPSSNKTSFIARKR